MKTKQAKREKKMLSTMITRSFVGTVTMKFLTKMTKKPTTNIKIMYRIMQVNRTSQLDNKPNLNSKSLIFV